MEEYINKIICGDCLQIMKGMPDKSVDLVLTDPPYELEERSSYGQKPLAKSLQKHRDELKEKNLTKSLGIEWCREIPRLQKNINCLIWCSRLQLKDYLNYFIDELNCNFDILIWNKTNAFPTFNNKYITDKEYCLFFRTKGAVAYIEDYESAKTIFVSGLNSKDKNSFGHPTIKPLNIIKRLVKNHSKENDIILDPFLGSGTIAVAAKQLHRNFIGIEISEKYCEIARQRLSQDLLF
mgnify:FL=1